jgi:hypothetical protein
MNTFASTIDANNASQTNQTSNTLATGLVLNPAVYETTESNVATIAAFDDEVKSVLLESKDDGLKFAYSQFTGTLLQKQSGNNRMTRTGQKMWVNDVVFVESKETNVAYGKIKLWIDDVPSRKSYNFVYYDQVAYLRKCGFPDIYIQTELDIGELPHHIDILGRKNARVHNKDADTFLKVADDNGNPLNLVDIIQYAEANGATVPKSFKLLAKCIFESKCTKSKCDFWHPVGHVPLKEVCDYGTKCTNGNCESWHPDGYVPVRRLCAYGTECAKVNCSYSHPDGKSVPVKQFKKKPCKKGMNCPSAKAGKPCQYNHPKNEVLCIGIVKGTGCLYRETCRYKH